MSTVSSNTDYTYVFGGASVASANLSLQFQLSTGATLPTGFGDSVAITLASDLQTALRTAGFADATVTVAKADQATTQYTLSGSTFV